MCVLLEGQIRKAKKGSTYRAQKEVDLERHWDMQEGFRDAYTQTVVKAIQNSDTDLSMALDASGVDAHSWFPYYPQDFTSGEPPKHECLKAKSNFALLHGFGRIVFQSFPMLEAQGTNLVLEVCSNTVCCVIMYNLRYLFLICFALIIVVHLSQRQDLP